MTPTYPLLLILGFSLGLMACSSDDSSDTPAGRTMENFENLAGSNPERQDRLGSSQPRQAEARTISQRVRDGYSAAGRPTADAGLHQLRKTEDILEWAGVDTDMSVIDVTAYSGYFTESLSWAVGLGGWVLAHNVPGALDRSEGQARLALEQRLANHRLPNVDVIEMDYAGLAAHFDPEFHAAVMANTLHDIVNFSGEAAALEALTSIHNILVPGGFLLLIDHIGEAERDNTPLHRIPPATARDLVTRAGFQITEESSLLLRDTDDASVSVFEPQLRGQTSQFIWKAIKPAP